MDRIWRWAWDRYGARYRWAALVVALPVSLAMYLFWSLLIVAVEKSDHYVQAATVGVGAALVLHCMTALADRRLFRPVEQWAAGHEVDRASTLEATYTYARRAVPRALWTSTVLLALVSVIVGVIAGANGSRLVQYAILGAAGGAGVQLIGGSSPRPPVM